MNGASGPLYWFFNSSGALESFEDYDYGDVLRVLRALGVRYVIVQTDPALADANKGRATRRAIRGQPEQIVTTRDFGGVTVFELSPWDEAPPAGAPERPPIRTGLAASTSHNPRDWSTRSTEISGRAGSAISRTRSPHLSRRTDRRLSPSDGWPFQTALPQTPAHRVSVGDASQRARLLLLGAVPVDRFSFMDFPLPPNTSRLIRLRQTGSTPMFYWSFHELELWERER